MRSCILFSLLLCITDSVLNTRSVSQDIDWLAVLQCAADMENHCEGALATIRCRVAVRRHLRPSHNHTNSEYPFPVVPHVPSTLICVWLCHVTVHFGSLMRLTASQPCSLSDLAEP